MQLTFEHTQKVTDGHNPAAWHSPDNVVEVLYTADGRLWAADAETEFGRFDDRDFDTPHLAAPDEGVENLSITYLPRMNFWATWRAPGQDSEGEPTGADAHRQAVFILKQETNKYLVDGSLQFNADDPGVSLSLTLENPAGIISTEDATEAPPGTRISVFFRAGDSGRFSLGIYYLDRITLKAGDPQVQLTARNATGKLLKDQTFDEDRSFGPATIGTVIRQILESAGVIAHKVENTSQTIGIEFPPDMTCYEGLMTVIGQIPGWQIREDVSGTIVVGSPSFVFNPGIYTFHRGRDCFSREIIRDDRETYSRVCIHDREFGVAVYRDVEFLDVWNLPRKKTLYVEVPEGTPEPQAETLAEHLAGRLGQVGIVESFGAPFRPHLQPGDQASIIETGRLPRTLGTITQVGLQFGRSGFFTDFTVDSGGVVKKPRIRDLIEEIGGKKDIGSGKLIGETLPE